MNDLMRFLSLVNVIWLFQSAIAGEVFVSSTTEVPGGEQPTCEKLLEQKEIIQYEIEILKLRLEILTKKHEGFVRDLKRNWNKCLMETDQNIMVHSNGNDEPKICMRNADQQYVCSKPDLPTNCADSSSINCSNGKCRIRNPLMGPSSFLVSCDATEGGGWTVIQRRTNGSLDFYRDWSEYQQGFGDIDGEFWIGLDKLYALTTTLAPVELFVQLIDFNDTLKYARYDSFMIGDKTAKYALKMLGGYTGTAGDALSAHKGSKFSTKDRDNDSVPGGSCAIRNHGGWWYNRCLTSNLNGEYYGKRPVPRSEISRGVCWTTFHDHLYSMKSVQMMIRPKNS